MPVFGGTAWAKNLEEMEGWAETISSLRFFIFLLKGRKQPLLSHMRKALDWFDSL